MWRLNEQTAEVLGVRRYSPDDLVAAKALRMIGIDAPMETIPKDAAKWIVGAIALLGDNFEPHINSEPAPQRVVATATEAVGELSINVASQVLAVDEWRLIGGEAEHQRIGNEREVTDAHEHAPLDGNLGCSLNPLIHACGTV